MQFDAFVINDIGKKREKNQDNFIFQNSIAEIGSPHNENNYSFNDSRPCLFGVFDGMGGQMNGERAAWLSADTAKELFASYIGGNPFVLLNDICNVANRRICDEFSRNFNGRMGSTAAMVFFDNNSCNICNLGDSSVFLIRQNEMKSLSVEHTDRSTYEKIYGTNYDKHKKFRLTQHLGILPEEMIIEPYCCYEIVLPEDFFVICSDGLTDMVDSETILSVIQNSTSAEAACRQLTDTALSNGGRDNITVIVIKAENFSVKQQRNVREFKKITESNASSILNQHRKDTFEPASRKNFTKSIIAVILIIITVIEAIVIGCFVISDSQKDRQIQKYKKKIFVLQEKVSEKNTTDETKPTRADNKSSSSDK